MCTALLTDVNAATALGPGCRRLDSGSAGVGEVWRCSGSEHHAAPYYVHLPPRPLEGAPVLVAVHGISRNAREMVSAFGAQAAKLGMVTVAPLFSKRRYPAYQRLGHSRRGVRSTPHWALDAILEEVALRTGAYTSKVYLFGFSGGAQFAHRYAMRYPHRVRSLALGSAGWYTFPDVTEPFPYGIGPTPLAAGYNPMAFLAVPALVLVGERDDERDSALNTAPRLDLQQGLTRIERGQRWREAMAELAARVGVDGSFAFQHLPDCGHEFVECARTGDLVARVLDFFVSSSRRRIGADGSSARNDSHLVFSAARPGG